MASLQWLATRVRGRVTLGLVAACFAVVGVSAGGTTAAFGQAPVTGDLTPPVQLTSEQDHQRLMDLLHITEMRRGPDGDPTSAHAANFDESKVAPYRLPDPLVLKNGQRVTTSAMWWKQRRPEIVADFDSEMYGRVPENVPKVTWQVVRTRHETIDAVSAVGPGREARAPIRVVTKDIVGHLDNSADPLITVNIQLTLTVPEKAAGPVPVIMEFGLAPAAQAVLRKRFTDAQWAVIQGTGPGWQSQVLAKGWGYAILIPTSVQADNGERLTQGVIGLTNKGQPRKPGEWGALRAWAWGASRAVDYFETDQSVDARQIGIEGLSRYGKATLVAMAYEPRLAIAFVGSSGEGGAKLSRRTFGEQVENIASTAEYHWMAGNFLKYAGPLTRNDLPVDAHELIALCAPRPVFISGGSQEVEGGWVDVKGTFLAAVAAGPVYKLLGKKDLGATEFPPLETALIDGDIAFRQHRAGHTTGPNWPTFLTFASRYVKGPALAQSADVGASADAAPARPPIKGVSHIAVYAAAPVKSERFYVHDLGAVRGEDPENTEGVRYYFASTQFVEVLPLPTGRTSINRLDHVAFTTTDVKGLRAYLASKQISVPATLQTGRDGSQWFDVTDPEGNKIEFVQAPASPREIPVNSLSSHIIHAGFIVHDRKREDSFFRTILGFRPYWFGGMEDDKPTWISQQVPDGTDWLEYMIVGTPDGHGIPPDLKAADLGVLDHFSLGVQSTEVAYTLLWNGGRLDGQTNTPKIGRDAKWQLNLLDPDGTRAEIMEFHAIGKPCCSRFTATDPQK
jgi:catechol 2,3-dioxygenase-like lactoylglutathione lyase family enzyme